MKPGEFVTILSVEIEIRTTTKSALRLQMEIGNCQALLERTKEKNVVIFFTVAAFY